MHEKHRPYRSKEKNVLRKRIVLSSAKTVQQLYIKIRSLLCARVPIHAVMRCCHWFTVWLADRCSRSRHVFIKGVCVFFGRGSTFHKNKSANSSRLYLLKSVKIWRRKYKLSCHSSTTVCLTLRTKCRRWALDRVQTHAGHSIAINMFCTLWPCDLDLWPFDLILNG